ncbi:MAG TPA: DNRLRE domain-containing protein, partial [Actinocrinis sp.]|uniref:DUF7402 domain-containing protein n=1 Tax=Actinocrinis sp. TaxID=1920516 RepID=UPI002DDC9714
MSADGAGNLAVADASGHSVFTAPAPLAWDSATTAPIATNDPASAPGPAVSSQTGPGRRAHETHVSATVRQGTITLAPPTSLLSDSGADFPIYLDPTFSPSYGNTGWASPGAGFPNDNHWDSTVDPTAGITQIGNSGGPEREALSLFDFPIDLNTLSGATIFSATFGITETHSWACLTNGHDQSVNLFAPADTLVASNGTWNDWIPNLGARIANENFALGGSGCPAGGIPAFDVANTVRGDVAAGKGTQTLVMRADNGSDNYAFKEFQANTANLTVTYDKTPNTPSGLSTSPATNCAGSVLGDTAVTLFAPVSTPTNSPLTTTINLYKTADGSRANLLTPANGIPSDQYSGGSGQAAVSVLPESFFRAQAGAAATSFSWLAQTTDGLLTSGWSSTCTFTWDPTRPGSAGIAPNQSAPSGTKTCAIVGDTTDTIQPVGTSCSFTLTPPSGGMISGYTYQVDQAAPVTVSGSGAATITVPLTRLVNTLVVNALSPGGNSGSAATVWFDGTTINPPAKDGDVTNDGTPDLTVPGGPGTAFPSGLWLAQGHTDGTVASDAVDIGVNGLAINTGADPADWNGSQAITGDFCGYGAQDVMAYFPAGANAGGGDIACNDGSSDPLHLGPPTSLGTTSAPFRIAPATFQDAGGHNAVQIADAGNTSGALDAHPDLFATINNQLYLFTSKTTNGYSNDVSQGFGLCSQDCDVLTSLNTPDGSQDWNSWTVATVQLASGTAMYLWNPSTGQLDLWTGLSLAGNGSTLSTTGAYVIAANWNTNVAGLVLHAADINGDGIPDLWATYASTRIMTAYMPTTLGNNPAIGTAVTTLSTPTHAWHFQDIGASTSGTALAGTADNISGLNLAGSGANAAWNTGDIYSPDASLNTNTDGNTPTAGGTGQLSANGPALSVSNDFTVSVHVKPNALGGVILSQDGADSSGFLLYPDVNNGKWYFCLAKTDNSVWNYDCASGGAAQLGAWTWLEATYEAATGTMTLYVNGVTAATASHTAVAGFTGPFQAGVQLYQGSHTSNFAGQVADIQIWNETLSVPVGSAGPILGSAGTVGADFSANNGTGHSDVFGATINALDDPAKMDTLQQTGMQLIRRDAYLFQIVPNTTVAAYKANMGVAGSVTDPSTWDWSKYAWVNQYHSRGFHILLIMSYDTAWLQQPNCGSCVSNGVPIGVPSDWGVYADIVKKIYQHFQGEVNMVEIWNEPDGGFLNVAGSPYGDNLSAYKDIYANASNAIRSVDSAIPIGGPVVSQPSLTSWGAALLQDPQIPANNINFLSYHDYSNPTGESVTAWKNMAAAAGRGPDFPVYVTEWNSTAAFDHDPLANDHPDAISYTGDRLTNLYKQQANGSTYYAYNDPLLAPDFYGIYANGTLLPKSRTIRLLSEDLGLGAGDSTIRGVSFASPVTNAGAATTATGDDVAWVVNDGTSPVTVTLNMTGLGAMSAAQANIFEASANQAVVSPKASVPLKVSGGNATMLVSAPAKSVVGVRLTPYAIAQQENIAPLAAVTASSQSAGLPASAATDGVIGVWGAGEWASNGELTPWIQLTWPTAQTVGRIVLYDRSNPIDQIHAGTLVFSDGSTVPIPELPNDGTGKAIDFAPRTVTSVKLQVTVGSGLNVGLSEIQVFRAANIAAQATLTASSAAGTATSARKTIDGIIGQSTGQWVSTETNPWLKATWLNTRTIDEVDLYDAVGTGGHANGGTLTFSDGSTINVTGIPTDGTVKAVTFPPISVTSVTFQATGGIGSNVGLSEIRVLEAPNLASSATATASSTYNDDPTFAASAATDGTIDQWYSGEWASKGELEPWIQLTWPTAQTLGHVVLYDRNNMIDQINAGTLTFSDGSSIPVSALDNSGLGE